jgi:hypothetical protein
MESKKGCLDVVVLERLESERPVVASSAVDKDESELEPADGNAVPKCNINMNNIEISGREPVSRLATWCFWDCCICAKGDRELAGIEECAIFCAGDDMLVVAKAAAAGEAIEVLRSVRVFGLGRIHCVTWADGRETRVGVVELGNYFLVGHTLQSRGRGAGGWCIIGGR